MLSYLDGLITESERQQMRTIEQLRAKGTKEAEAAARAIEARRGERFAKHSEERKTVPGLMSGIQRRKEAAARKKKTSHSTQLFKRLEQIGDAIADRIRSNNPNTEEELNNLYGQLNKLTARHRTVKKREQSGAPSKREERNARKGGPDLH
jgi:uncharacterized protein YdcH (DUF465 family)